MKVITRDIKERLDNIKIKVNSVEYSVEDYSINAGYRGTLSFKVSCKATLGLIKDLFYMDVFPETALHFPAKPPKERISILIGDKEYPIAGFSVKNYLNQDKFNTSFMFIEIYSYVEHEMLPYLFLRSKEELKNKKAVLKQPSKKQ